MNYKYGNAIVLGLFLATLSMSKVASAALIEYEIAAYTENYGENFWDVSFRGAVIIDSTTADIDGFYAVDESGFSDYSLKYWYDGDDYSYSSILGFPPEIDFTFTLNVIFNPDHSWSYASFDADGNTDTDGFAFNLKVYVGCTGQDLQLRGNDYCQNKEEGWVIATDENFMFDIHGVSWSVVDDYEDALNGPVILVPEPYTVSIFVLGIIGLATRRFIKQS